MKRGRKYAEKNEKEILLDESAETINRSSGRSNGVRVVIL